MVRRDTKELVLATALQLFNLDGEPNVSTNHIAIEADISPGNLYYHFSSKDEIVLDLFKRYLVIVHPLISGKDSGEDGGVEDLWLRLHLIFEAMGRFRFMFRDLPDLYGRIPSLRHAVHGLLARQLAMLTAMFGELQSQGAMNIGEHDREMLAENVLLSMTHWIAFAEVRRDPGLEDGTAQARAVARVLHQIHPYLRAAEAELLESLAHRYRAAT